MICSAFWEQLGSQHVQPPCSAARSFRNSAHSKEYKARIWNQCREAIETLENVQSRISIGGGGGTKIFTASEAGKKPQALGTASPHNNAESCANWRCISQLSLQPRSWIYLMRFCCRKKCWIRIFFESKDTSPMNPMTRANAFVGYKDGISRHDAGWDVLNRLCDGAWCQRVDDLLGLLQILLALFCSL